MNSVKRLYDQFHPNNYKIELSPDIKTETFTGKIVISGIKVGPSSSRLTLHQLDLRIINSKVIYHTKSEDKIVDIVRLNYHRKFNELRLHSNSTIRSGKYTIELEFKGRITKELSGMYISQHKIGNITKKIITTQFESHSAREVFPCIDEPEAKATFDLTIIHPTDKKVISNTQILNSSQLSKTETKTTFATTPIMSTYLLAFIVGDLEFRESKTKNGTVVRSYATSDKIDYVDFSLEVAVKCIDFYNDYFDIPYPIDKCDLIALPDFASGAMENWGCITFREQAMLVDPKRSSLINKQYVALVIAHELSHQWFGNLVTMKWWTDLWLNEGFATWMEYFAINDLFPDWNLWIQFIVDEQQIALNLDSLENTHPVEVRVKHPDEIRTIFDSISYSKGASVIHMLHEFVGPANFRLGLQNYLKKFSYKNTDTNDLWNAIGAAANKPVANFMSAWTMQKGYPIIECKAIGSRIELSQKKFDYLADNPDDSLWPVALISNNNYLPEIFDRKTRSYKANFESVKLNNGQTGFYRVIYDDKNLQKLGKLIQSKKIEDVDRLGILSDLLETSKANLTDITTILKFLKFYDNETSYAVWDVITLVVGSIRHIICDEPLRERIKPYIKDLITNEMDRLGIKPIKGEDHFDTLLRPIILAMTASLDDKLIISFCNEQFKLMTSEKSVKDVNPDFKSFILYTVARHGSALEYDQMVKMHNQSNLSEERTTLITAITSFKQPELIDKTLKFISSEYVRSQDISYWIAYSFNNRFAKNKTWEWLKQNWKWLEDTIGTDLSFFRMPLYVARAFSEEKFIDEYQKFFVPILTPSFERSYKQGMEVIAIQSAWRRNSSEKVKEFIDSYSSSK
ncbi:MAG TPA: M1 family metallopeptidase [Candidatus Dormibacteraeota bacterium]|nr:M1 family metallopeptidase [Candidatus Dormibacteraeota bacterium]